MVPIDWTLGKHLGWASDLLQVETWLKVVKENMTGFYSERQEIGVAWKEDKILGELAQKVHLALENYLEHLRSLPNVWSGLWDEPKR
jgi:hypothetical protein